MYNENLFNPYEGLIRGNIFKNLYQPYLNNPINIEPKDERQEILTKIDALTFSLLDLNLYLDIYTDDKNIISLFNQYNQELKNLTNIYEKKYNPLSLNSNYIKWPWNWDDKPWPWN